MKKWPLIASMMVIMVASVFAGAGTIAYFNDTETSSGNVFQAGILNLWVDGKNDPDVASFTFDKMRPRTGSEDEVQLRYILKNVGNIPGYLGIEFYVYDNDDNGLNEPEKEAGDTTGGAGEGELYYKLKAYWGYATDGGMPACCGFIEMTFDDLDGYIWSRETVSVDYPPLETSPQGTCFRADMDLLGSGEEIELWITVFLPSDVGNEVQSDSIKLDVIFHLAQVSA